MLNWTLGKNWKKLEKICKFTINNKNFTNYIQETLFTETIVSCILKKKCYGRGRLKKKRGVQHEKNIGGIGKACTTR